MIEKKIPYSPRDKRAYNDAESIDKHFGFPYDNVYSIALNDNGLVNVHETKESDRPRLHYLADLLGIQYFRKRHRDAIIWGERYCWEPESVSRDQSIRKAQTRFVELMGVDKIKQVNLHAQDRGLKPTTGLPDLCIFEPTTNKWTFAELKRDKEKVRSEQIDWMDFLSSEFGEQSVYVVRFVLRYG